METCSLKVCTCLPDFTFSCEKGPSDEVAKKFNCPACDPQCEVSIKRANGKCECSCTCEVATSAPPPFTTRCPFPYIVHCGVGCEKSHLNSSEIVEHCKKQSPAKLQKHCIGCPADVMRITKGGVLYCVGVEHCCKVRVDGKDKIIRVSERMSFGNSEQNYIYSIQLFSRE